MNGKVTPETGTAAPATAMPTFEAALSRLEEIVRRLESLDVGLKEAMALFEEGVGLARHCSDLLAQAEKRIEILVDQGDGTFSLKPFEVPGGPAGATPR